MALRVPKAELPSELSQSMIEQFGVIPEPLQVMWHNPKVGEDSLALGGRVGAWDATDSCSVRSSTCPTATSPTRSRSPRTQFARSRVARATTWRSGDRGCG